MAIAGRRAGRDQGAGDDPDGRLRRSRRRLAIAGDLRHLEPSRDLRDTYWH